MRHRPSFRRLLAAAAAVIAATAPCNHDRGTSAFSPTFLYGEASNSVLNATVGNVIPSKDRLLLNEQGVTPRRLSVSAAMINLVTQAATSSDMRQMMGQWFTSMGEVLGGPDTSESTVPYYWKIPECVITVDFASYMGVGVADSAKIGMAYIPKHHVIMLAFVEESPEIIQVLKRPQRRIQLIGIPTDCMVDASNTYTAFCSKPSGRCFMTRLDIQLTRITKQMLVDLEPVSAEDFVRQQLEEGDMYDDAVDILDSPTAVGRMLFDPLKCIMHCRVNAADAAHVYVFHNPLDNSLRVDAQSSDGSWFRKKVIIIAGCGGVKKEDFTTVVYRQIDGHYKVIIKTPIAGGTELNREGADNIEIRKGSEKRPVEAYEYGVNDLRDLYFDANFIPYESMVVGYQF